MRSLENNIFLKNKYFRRTIILGFILLLLYFIHPFILNWMGSRLIASDKIQKADVILVLAGDNNGERVNEGVALYKKGYAPRMLMSGGPLAWHLTYAEWMKKQAILLGVPERSILIQDRSLSTIEDAKFSLPIIKEKNIKSVILVTSPAHTRRAKRVFNKVFSADKIQVMVWPVKKSDFNPKYWWKSNEDIQIVVYEYTCEIFYFMKGY